MARMAYITGVAALLSAGILLARCITMQRQGLSDGQSETLSVVDQFTQSMAGTPVDSEGMSPLIRQAEIYALYLNPPPPAQRRPSPSRTQRAEPVVATRPKPVTASPKFELGGISYHRSKPERSRALLREPDGAYRWVRRGAEWGHITIVEIRNDSILYTDGIERREMAFIPPEPHEATPALARASAERQTVSQRLPDSAPITPRPRPARQIRQIPLHQVAANGIAVRGR